MSDKCPSCGKSYRVKKGGCLKWGAISLFAFILLIAGCVALVSSGGDENATVKRGTGSENGQASAEGNTAAVGDTLELKGTSYKVTSVRTAKAVGGEFTRVQADGTFVIVNLTLTNGKDEPATILEDAVRLVGGNGSEYTVDTDTLGVFDNALVILETIQPGLAQKVVAVYDVPPGAVSGAKLQVKDLFSDSKGEIDLGL